MKSTIQLITAFALCFLTFAFSAISQTTLTGDHIIDGYLDVNGATFTLDADTTTGGVTFQFDDATVKEISIINNQTSAASWIWGYDDGVTPTSGVTIQMNLDKTNKLTLYDPSSPFSSKIVIDPDATSPKITIDGNEVITTSVANGSSLSIQAGSGIDSIIMGSHTTTTTGDYSYAFGFQSEATGLKSAAFGNASIASGNYSLAAGNNAQALGKSSFAFGPRSYARDHQFVIGRFNAELGSLTAWSDTDPLFIIGNGADIANRSNAFIVYKNGNTWMDGGLNVAGTFLSVAGGSAYTNTTGSAAFFTGAVAQFNNSFAISGHAAHNHTVAIGVNSLANSPDSIAIGTNSTASGNKSITIGDFAETTSTADRSVAIGHQTTAQSSTQVAIGYNNLPVADSVLMVGHGTSGVAQNRMIIFREGNANLDGRLNASGGVRVPQSGDISMGSFTSSPAGLGDPSTLGSALDDFN